jgi:protein NRD1
MLTAEYGGSGGRPIETGLVVEEPDIEIGAGVSSKGKYTLLNLIRLYTDRILAISRRMATDSGGKLGPKSTRTNTGTDRFRRNDRHDGGGSGGSAQDRDQNSNPNNIGVPPAVPGFGFNFPGMPMLAQNFMMGGQGQQPPGT